MKSAYKIFPITKHLCKNLLCEYHYLTSISRGFRSGINYGLFKDGDVVGVCIFTGLSVPQQAKAIFGLEPNEQQGLFELSRLALHPFEQQKEHNLAGWFVARCIKHLRKNNDVKAILSYADNDYHKGTIYRALGFDYYGLSDPKNDFWIKQSDGSFIKHNRGQTKNLQGEWRRRSQKHRFLKVFDKNLSVLWEKQNAYI